MSRLNHPFARIAALTLSATVLVSAAATGPLQTVAAQGPTELKAIRVQGQLVRVLISQGPVSDSVPSKSALVWGGDVGRQPKTVVTSLQVACDNVPVVVPLSAYNDLGDVKFASLAPVSSGFVLNIHGGSTAAAYDAQLTLSCAHLISRSVQHREFPEQRWERTQYSFVENSE